MGPLRPLFLKWKTHDITTTTFLMMDFYVPSPSFLFLFFHLLRITNGKLHGNCYWNVVFYLGGWVGGFVKESAWRARISSKNYLCDDVMRRDGQTLNEYGWRDQNQKCKSGTNREKVAATSDQQTSHVAQTKKVLWKIDSWAAFRGGVLLASIEVLLSKWLAKASVFCDIYDMSFRFCYCVELLR